MMSSLRLNMSDSIKEARRAWLREKVALAYGEAVSKNYESKR